MTFSTILASYVKVYLVNGKKCIAKAKTMAARKTLDPFYQQSLAFRENCRGCILQVFNYKLLSFYFCQDSSRFRISIYRFCVFYVILGNSVG